MTWMTAALRLEAKYHLAKSGRLPNSSKVPIISRDFSVERTNGGGRYDFKYWLGTRRNLSELTEYRAVRNEGNVIENQKRLV